MLSGNKNNVVKLDYFQRPNMKVEAQRAREGPATSMPTALGTLKLHIPGGWHLPCHPWEQLPSDLTI